MLGMISDVAVDKLYATAIDILVGLLRKDLVDRLENMINLRVYTSDTNLNKVHEIIDVIKDGLPPEE